MNHDSTVPNDNKITPVNHNIPSLNVDSRLGEVIIERIPIYQEEFDVTKEVTKTKLYLEKRWIKSTKKIEIPINYEEMFINGKEFDYYSHNELIEIFSKVKEKISEVFHPTQTEGKENQLGKRENGDSRQYPYDLEIKLRKDEDEQTTKATISQTEKEPSQSEKRPVLPNSEPRTNDSHIQVSDINNNDSEEEQIIPIWGEQLIIDKKMVKLGEIVIKKSTMVEKRQVNVEVRKEKITVKYPDGNKQEFI